MGGRLSVLVSTKKHLRFLRTYFGYGFAVLHYISYHLFGGYNSHQPSNDFGFLRAIALERGFCYHLGATFLISFLSAYFGVISKKFLSCWYCVFMLGVWVS